jgi:hypothetical protein
MLLIYYENNITNLMSNLRGGQYPRCELFIPKINLRGVVGLAPRYGIGFATP